MTTAWRRGGARVLTATLFCLGLSQPDRSQAARLEPQAGSAQASGRGTHAAPPSRIISVVPAVTEMLFAMEAGSKVVGVSSFDTFPPDVLNRPRVGALFDPDFERILSLKPDLVVVYGSQTELIDRLQRVGIDVFNYRHAGLADVTTTVRQLGDRIGHPVQAGRLAQRIEADLNRVRASVAGRPRPRTVLLFGREAGALRSMYASAGVGFMHDLLEVAGGSDVFADVKRESLQVSTEVLLARAPAVIVEVHPTAGWTPARVAQDRAVWQQLPALPAVQAGRIHILTDDLLLVPGPRVAEAARMIAEAIHTN